MRGIHLMRKGRGELAPIYPMCVRGGEGAAPYTPHVCKGGRGQALIHLMCVKGGGKQSPIHRTIASNLKSLHSFSQDSRKKIVKPFFYSRQTIACLLLHIRGYDLNFRPPPHIHQRFEVLKWGAKVRSTLLSSCYHLCFYTYSDMSIKGTEAGLMQISNFRTKLQKSMRGVQGPTSPTVPLQWRWITIACDVSVMDHSSHIYTYIHVYTYACLLWRDAQILCYTQKKLFTPNWI